MYHYLIAVVVLLGDPDEAPRFQPTPEEFPAIAAAVNQLALDLEIEDPREAKYLLAKPEDWNSEINILCRRYQYLKDAPPLSDFERLPTRETAMALKIFNREVKAYWLPFTAIPGDKGRAARDVVDEIDRCWVLWDAISDAGCIYYYVQVRREYMAKLRHLIGPDNYNAGRWPDHVPMWLFEERE